MKSSPFLVDLKSRFSPSDWRALLLAFRQDALVWETLEQTDLGKQALEILPTRLEKWSPAMLSLLAQGLSGDKERQRVLLEDLCSFPTPPLDVSWKDRGSKAYQECIYNGKVPQTLEQSGRLALALRERYRLDNSWQEVFQNEVIRNAGKTTLACLYGMIQNPQDLLMALLQPGSGLFRPDLVVHMMLSTPLLEEVLRAKLVAMCGRLDLKQNQAFLCELAVQRSWMADGLAQQLLDSKGSDWLLIIGSPGSGIESGAGSTSGDLDQQFEALTSSVNLARVYRFADQPDHAVPLLAESLRTIQYLRGHLSADLAQAVFQSRNSGDDGWRDTAQETGLEAWKQAFRLVPDSPHYSSSLALALMETGHFDEARSILEDQRLSNSQESGENRTEHPVLLLTSALVALQLGDREGSRQATLQALAALENGQELSQHQYITLARLFLEAKMHQEVARTAQIGIVKSPLNRDLLALLAQTQLLLGKPAEALINAYTALALSHDSSSSRGACSTAGVACSDNGLLQSVANLSDGDILRVVINSLEAVGEWQAALEERKAMMETLAAPTMEDLHALMYCAVQAGHAEQAIQTGQKVLEIDPQDLLAHQVLAEASLALGDYQSAVQHFDEGVRLDPYKSSFWLGLVKAHRMAGEETQALTTLRAASQVVPDEPEIHLTLGEILMEQGELTQSLACLRRASNLSEFSTNSLDDDDSASARIALRLGQALYQLGHLEEARQVLSRAYEAAGYSHPNAQDDETESPWGDRPAGLNLELVYAYARVLLGLRELNLAIPMLTEVVRCRPDEPGSSLDLARALLLVDDQPTGARRAIPFLHRILGVNPDGAEGGYHARLDVSPELRAEARSTLAEAYAAIGDWSQSMEAYRRALDEPLNREPGKQKRLSLGLGMVALKLEQPEVAVAALEEAAHSEPLDAPIQRALSEAYLSSGLPRDALQSARAALDLNPGDLDTLLWFAEQGRRILAQPTATQLPIREAVTQALRTAVQLAPGRLDVLYRLCKASHEAGDRSGALEVFRRLASADDLALWITPEEIHQTAEALQDLGEPHLAISLLIRVVEKYWESPQAQGDKTTSLVTLYQELASAYQQAGNLEAALQAMEQTLSLDADQIELYLRKADLLYELGWLEAARECLESALSLAPQDPTLHYRIAQVLHLLGDLAVALFHSEQAIATSQDLSLSQSLHLLAAELAYATLRPHKARDHLAEGLPKSDALYNEFRYVSLRAELALDAGEEALASQEINVLEKTAPSHPRTLGARARLYGLQADRDAGAHTCSSAVKALIEWQTGIQSGKLQIDQEEYIASLLCVSQAALELRQWDEALTLLQQAVSLAPNKPLVHFRLARALVVRAEAQCLCQDLEVLVHAPGEVALAEKTKLLFESSIHEAERRTQDMGGKEAGGVGYSGDADWRKDESRQMLAIWLVRGRAVFQPVMNNAQLLERVLQAISPFPEDIAALIMILRRCGEVARAMEVPQVGWQPSLDGSGISGHPLVLIHMALSEPDLQKAMNLAEEALDRIFDQDPDGAFTGWPEPPMLYFLLARLAYRTGAYAEALLAIQKGLATWPQEARWHALAAQIYQAEDPDGHLPDSTKMLMHLEQAASFEPGRASNYLALGLAYLESGQFDRSAKALEKASHLDAHQSSTWLLLARAQQAAGDLEGAAASAERAMEGSADNSEVLLLRGEIALQASNPRGALSRAQAILRAQPSHPQGLCLLAKAMEALDRPADALAALEKAMRLLDNPPSMQLERLQLLRRTQGLDNSLASLQEMVANDPEQPELLALLAEWLAEVGKNEEAIQTARQALQEGQSGLSNQRTSDLHFMIGRCMRNGGQLDQAIHHLSEAIEHFPDQLEIYLELGRAYQDRREYKQALKVYQKAINIAGNDYRPYYQAGMILKDSKDYLAAEAMLRRAAQLAPNEVSVHRLLAAVIALNLVHSHRLVSVEK